MLKEKREQTEIHNLFTPMFTLFSQPLFNQLISPKYSIFSIDSKIMFETSNSLKEEHDEISQDI